jgi:hypothetical protein
MNRSTSRDLEISAVTASTKAPNFSALSFTIRRLSCDLEQIASLAPSFAKANVKALPNPLEAPVIITTFLFIYVISPLLLDVFSILVSRKSSLRKKLELYLQLLDEKIVIDDKKRR